MNGRPASSSGLRRYGPLIGIVVVVAVVAAIAIVASRGSDSQTTTATTSGLASSREGVVTWSDAEANGTTQQIDWGARCDTTIGKLKYPSFFAPECYAPFKGDNGGATADGVTGDSIKVVLYLTPENDPLIDFITSAISVDDTNEQVADTVRGMVGFYEYFFETYGRKVDLVVYTGTGPSEDEVAARADAVTIANMHPFAVVGGPLLTPAFADELAARSVLCIQCGPAQSHEFYEQRDPNVWAVANNAEQSFSHAAEYVTKRLAGKDAEWAGDPALQTQPRKFGFIYLSTGAESDETAKQFEDQLAAGNAAPAVTLTYNNPVDLQTSAPQLIARLKDAGVTTVLFSGDPIAPQPLTRAATAQQFAPEWVLTSTVLADTTTFGRTYDQEQWKHAFGISTLAARTNPDNGGTKFLYKWFYGTDPPAAQSGAVTIVPAVNLLFAVIQGVGPNLTHENFRDALFAADPTPHALTQPSLSYGNKGIWPYPDFLGIDDATELWWDPTATGLDEINRTGTGMYAYVDGGKRYLPGQWPTSTPKAFDPAGAVTIYDTPPPSEQVPDYPPPNR